MAISGITVVDLQSDWREFACRALRDEGYVVTPVAAYESLLSSRTSDVDRPELVILGCASIGLAELQLIAHLHGLGIRTLVFSASMPPKYMRALFLLGVNDVIDKSFSEVSIRSAVRATLGRPLRRELSTHQLAIARERFYK